LPGWSNSLIPKPAARAFLTLDSRFAIETTAMTTVALPLLHLFAQSRSTPLASIVGIREKREDSQIVGSNQSAAAKQGSAERRTTRAAVEERQQHREWMRLIAGGDVSAYRKLCDRFLGPITGYAHRLLGDGAEAEDVAQETFLRIWKNADRYVPTAATSTWIYRIAHNLCVDRLRRTKDTSDRVSQLDVEDRPSLLLDRKQIAAQVEEALAALPEKQRAAICLIHYEGLNQVEASQILEVSVEALESLLARGRRSLRKTLASLRLKEPA